MYIITYPLMFLKLSIKRHSENLKSLLALAVFDSAIDNTIALLNSIDPLLYYRTFWPIPWVPITELHPTDEDLAKKLQPSHEDAQQARDAEVADAGPDVEPAALVAHHPEEVHGQNIADGDDNHEQTAWRNAEAAVEDAEVGADEGERDEEFEKEEGALGERVEDGDEPVDGV